MRKQIRKIGNSIGVIFTHEDRRVYKFKLKDIIDFEPVIMKKNKEVKDD